MYESDGLPLYLKIKEIILQRIISFTYDDRLPGELLLADEFKVARGTIKQAIDALVRYRYGLPGAGQRHLYQPRRAP